LVGDFGEVADAVYAAACCVSVLCAAAFGAAAFGAAAFGAAAFSAAACCTDLAAAFGFVGLTGGKSKLGKELAEAEDCSEEAETSDQVGDTEGRINAASPFTAAQSMVNAASASVLPLFTLKAASAF